ncbi:MAG TPA: lasso peptide biosynthesis B2 protein [Gemmatimonadaceae bacterium]|nr:lasso peptide biosynthesis B2 protein [Gemmatimonadaceae bacterium]
MSGRAVRYSAWRCVPAVVGLKVVLVILGFARTMRLVDRLVAGRRVAVEPVPAWIEAVARGVVTAAVFCPGRVECLEQSMALYFLLRRHGVAAELRFGVRTHPFAAHAWVLHRGVAVNEELERLQQFAVFE